MFHRPPKNASKRLQVEFLTKGAIVVGISIVTFSCAGIGAILIVRQARLEYQEAQAMLLQRLIEETQDDIRKKQNAKP